VQTGGALHNPVEMMHQPGSGTGVAHLAGHANVETTFRYNRRENKVKEKVASLLHVPYTGRRLPSMTSVMSEETL
jgi:hypothetical protein